MLRSKGSARASLAIALALAVSMGAYSSANGSSHLAVAASAEAASRGAPGPVSFKRDLVPLFRDNCTMCHQGESPMGALNLTPDVAYDNLVGIQAINAQMMRVAPGHPESSYLHIKTSGQNARVKGGGYGMPWGPPMAAGQIDLITRWIKQGAKNN